MIVNIGITVCTSDWCIEKKNAEQDKKVVATLFLLLCIKYNFLPLFPFLTKDNMGEVEKMMSELQRSG